MERRNATNVVYAGSSPVTGTILMTTNVKCVRSINMCMKRCNRCQQEKLETEFNWRVTGITRHSYCRECGKSYTRADYQRKKTNYKNRSKTRRLEICKHIFTKLSNSSCIECSESRIECLDFHHRDSSQKEFCIALAPNMGVSDERLESEIAKCDILCANCHRIRTAKEFGWYTRSRGVTG